jgi:hypothetical protein
VVSAAVSRKPNGIISVESGVKFDHHAVGGELLGAVTGDSITTVEVPHRVRIEGSDFVVSHAISELPVVGERDKPRTVQFTNSIRLVGD